MTAPALPVLYSFRRCPYAIRARLALHQAGVAVELREVALRDKPAALLAISPKGTVPVLQLQGGQVLEQSLDIMRWALQQADPQGWLTAGGADPDGAAARHWIDLNDMRFKPLLDRYKYAPRHPELPMEEHRAQALAALIAPMDATLRASPQLLGQHLSLADAALFPFVRQFAMVDKAWFDGLPLPGVQRWLAHWLASPGFAAVMGKAVAQPPRLMLDD